MRLFRKRAKKTSNEPDHSEEILFNMKILARVEDEVSRFYRRCAEAFVGGGDFMEQMAAREQQHAIQIRKMEEMVRNNPEEFSPGEHFSTASLRLFELTIRDMPDLKRLKEMDLEKVLKMVQDIESFAVETSYSAVVETRNPEFRRLAGKIDRANAEQRKVLRDRLSTGEGEDNDAPREKVQNG